MGLFAGLSLSGKHGKLLRSGNSCRKAQLSLYCGCPLNSYNLFKTTTYELGHAHHDHIYDGLFGASVDFNYAEAWAYAAGYFMTTAAYSNMSHGDEVTMQGWKFGVQYRLPLMIDMADIFNQRSEESDNLQDFISGYTVRQLETIISYRDCKTINDFANKIKALSLPTGITNTILTDYFNQYNNISSPSYAETKHSGGFYFTKGQKNLFSRQTILPGLEIRLAIWF